MSSCYYYNDCSMLDTPLFNSVVSYIHSQQLITLKTLLFKCGFIQQRHINNKIQLITLIIDL